MKRLTIILTLLTAGVLSRADLLTDIVSGQYKPQQLPQQTAMSDGEHYATLENGCVIARDYKTGTHIDTLFDCKRTKLQKIETVDGYLLSPSDRYMLVYTNSKKIFRRSTEADWYIYDRQRGELKPLSAEMPVRDPVFSPNGKYIAFSRGNNLYIHKLDFGTEVAVTTDGQAGSIVNGTADWLYEEEFGITSQYAFSPDSKQLAFVRLDESQVPVFSWQTYLQEGDKYEYPQTHEIRYPRAGEQNAVAQVVVYDTYYKSLKTMQLPEERDSYIPRIRWTQQPDQFAIFRLNRNQNKLEMYMANPKSAVTKRIYTEENKDGYVDYSEVDEWEFYDDNTMLVVNETSGWRHAYLYTMNGQKLKQLTSGSYDVTSVYGYDPLSQTLLYQAALPDAMNRQVFAMNVKKQKTTCLTPELGMSSATLSADWRYMTISYQSSERPLSYKLMTREGKMLRELLNNDALLEKAEAAGLPKKEFFSFVTERGDTLWGWILIQKESESNVQRSTFNEPGSTFKETDPSPITHNLSPLLLYQYSGPGSQEVLNRWKIDWEYYLAKEKGIVVACIDPRGTNCRGRKFRNLTYMNIGQKEAEDQISAANYLVSTGLVDKERMAIWGWSYGGFQTLMTMSQPSSPFRCGIAVAPVTDFRLYDSAYTERFMRRPQTNEGGYKKCALPLLAEQLQGRVLLVHGVADDNVHCQNMWIYVDALVRAGKQFEMQIYPDDNHFLRKRENYEHLYRRMTDFLEKNL